MGKKTTTRRRRRRGAHSRSYSAVNCSIPALINNIKGKTWLKVDEMKSLYNAKTPEEKRGERRGGGEDGEVEGWQIFLLAGSQGDRILHGVCS